MQRLFNILAPRSKLDLIAKILLMQCLITSFDLGADVIFLTEYNFSYLFFRGASSYLIGLPFVTTAFIMLSHLTNMQRDLEHLASTDSLTGLSNRRAFLERSLEMLKSNQNGGILLLADIDHFKLVNDSFGHTVGDNALCAVAEAIESSLRPGDLAGRLGGEEFAIFLPGASTDLARQIGQTLCDGIALSKDDHGVNARLTLSVGAVKLDCQNCMDLGISRADTALYQAKNNGRARLVFDTQAVITTSPSATRIVA